VPSISDLRTRLTVPSGKTTSSRHIPTHLDGVLSPFLGAGRVANFHGRAGMAELADAADSKSLFCFFIFSEVAGYFEVGAVALDVQLLWKSGNCRSLSAKV